MHSQLGPKDVVLAGCCGASGLLGHTRLYPEASILLRISDCMVPGVQPEQGVCRVPPYLVLSPQPYRSVPDTCFLLIVAAKYLQSHAHIYIDTDRQSIPCLCKRVCLYVPFPGIELRISTLKS